VHLRVFRLDGVYNDIGINQCDYRGELNMGNDDLSFLEEALKEAKKGLAEGGIPIGSVIVREDKIIGRGHNRRIQLGSPILHAEMDALQNAGRLLLSAYLRCTLYTTLSPCIMCSGAILLYRIPRVVIGENRNFVGAEDLLKSKGVDLTVLDNEGCFKLLKAFIDGNPNLWCEDICTDPERSV
jgi:cytosine/creatinine deaminase